MCLWECSYKWVQYPQKQEDSIESPGDRVTRSCELNNMGAGSQICVLRRVASAVNLMNHFSSPFICSYICFYLSRGGSVLYHDIYTAVKGIVGISSLPPCKFQGLNSGAFLHGSRYLHLLSYLIGLRIYKELLNSNYKNALEKSLNKPRISADIAAKKTHAGQWVLEKIKILSLAS